MGRFALGVGDLAKWMWFLNMTCSNKMVANGIFFFKFLKFLQN